MAPQIIREPRSIEDAITRHIADLGMEACQEAVGGKVDSLIRRWSLPHDKVLPSVMQALLLDREAVRRGAPPHIHAVCGRKLAEAMPAGPLRSVPAAERMARLAKESGEGIAALRVLDKSRLSPDEARAAKRELVELAEEVERAIADLDARMAQNMGETG